MKKYMILLLTGLALITAGCAASEEEKAESTVEASDTMTAEEKQPGEKSEAEASGQEGEKETGKAEEEGINGNRYTWQEVTVTLPASWEGRVTVEETEDGFQFYQSASYGMDGGTGFVWGLFRTKERIEMGTGELLAAFSDEGVLYYVVQPLDLDCGSEEEQVLGEYVRMCNEAALFASNALEVAGAHCHAEEYILPTSGILPLDWEELAGLSDNELWLAENEICARHGKMFENSYLQWYFDRCTWYEGTVSEAEFDEGMLSQTEEDNLSLLADMEEAYRMAHPYPKKYSAGEVVYEDLDGDGNPEEILYQADAGGQCLLTVNGNVYDASEEAVLMTQPMTDCFYITNVSEEDGTLEIAVLDEGPSEDPQTCFFLYSDGTVSHMGVVPGFPFAEYNQGINGFNNCGNVLGMVRMDLIETVYLTDNWQYDHDIPWISYRNLSVFRDIIPARGHELYEDLPVRYSPEETASGTLIPAQEQVFFLSSDMYQWILVKGKDGSRGYMLVEDGIVVDLGKPAEEVFSDLYYFD